VAVLIVAVIAAVAFLAVRIAGDAEIPGFGDDDGPAESAPSGAPEGADGDDAPPADDDPAPPPETRAPVAPFGPTGLVRIEREVAARIGRDRPRYTQIIASDEFAIFTVLVGGGRLDAYTWREGVVTGPGEVRVTGNPGYTPAQAAFTRGDVRLAALPRLVRRAERIPLGSGTEVSTAIIQRFLPFSSGVVFLVNTSGGRGNAQLRANARGKVTEIIR
jgi:hypothetical protein